MSKFRHHVIRKKEKWKVQESSEGLAARAASVDLPWKRSFPELVAGASELLASVTCQGQGTSASQWVPTQRHLMRAVEGGQVSKVGVPDTRRFG